MQPKTTEYLIKKAKRREPDAFAQLMQLSMKDMYRVALAILMNDEDAADAVQDAILACWEKIHTLKQPQYFRTWLTRILIRKCYDIRRERERTVDLEACEEPVYEDRDNLELKEALAALPEKYRIVMVLYYGQGYYSREIAQLLRIPVSTVQTRLQRGREKLTAYFHEKR